MPKSRPRKSLPSDLHPMLCTLVDRPFDDPQWIFEPKLDGLRVICRFDGERLSLISRNDKEQNLQFPDLVEAMRKSLLRPTVLDGEIVCLDEQGNSSFRKLQQRFHVLDPPRDRAAGTGVPRVDLRLRPALPRRQRPADAAAGGASGSAKTGREVVGPGASDGGRP